MPTMREALEAHMDKVEAESTAEPVAPAAEAAPVAKVEAPVTVPGNMPAAPIGERARDESGKFTKNGTPGAPPKGDEKAGQVAAAAPGEAKAGGETSSPQAPVSPPAEAAPPPKVPQSFTPAMRELAAKLPPEFRPLLEHQLKRDAEIEKGLRESAQARQLAHRVQETLAPYETVARANGTDAMTFAQNVLQTATALQMGNQGQKDALLANLITTYGGTVEGINAHLDGKAAAPQAPPVDIRAEFQRMWDEQRQRASYDTASQQAAKFLEAKPEFITDVWKDMGPILSAAQANGVDMTYEEAYSSACWANPKTRPILLQREAAKSVASANAATQKAVEAGSGVRTSPAPPRTAPRDLRGSLEAKADELGLR